MPHKNVHILEPTNFTFWNLISKQNSKEGKTYCAQIQRKDNMQKMVTGTEKMQKHAVSKNKENVFIYSDILLSKSKTHDIIYLSKT